MATLTPTILITLFLYLLQTSLLVSGEDRIYSPNRSRLHKTSRNNRNNGRSYQTLSSWWDITPGTPSYNSLTFTFPYTIHTSKVSNVAVEVLDANCNTIDSSAFNATTDMSLDGTGSVNIEIDPTLIGSSATYSESGGDATIVFCHRFSLFEDATEVNFAETVATISVDLSHDFSVTSVDVARAEALTSTSNIQYTATAYYCDELGNNVPISDISQGLSIKVCIEPDDNSIVKIDKIAEFVWASDTGITQYAVTGDGTASNAFTVVDCSSLSSKCSFESLLVANFFQETPMSVSSTGTVYLQFATSRNLQRGGEFATSDEKKYASVSVVDTPSLFVSDVTSSAKIHNLFLENKYMWAFIASTLFTFLFEIA